MSLIGKITKTLISEIKEDTSTTASKKSLAASNIEVATEQVLNTVSEVDNRVITDPKADIEDLSLIHIYVYKRQI